MFATEATQTKLVFWRSTASSFKPILQPLKSQGWKQQQNEDVFNDCKKMWSKVFESMGAQNNFAKRMERHLNLSAQDARGGGHSGKN